MEDDKSEGRTNHKFVFRECMCAPTLISLAIELFIIVDVLQSIMVKLTSGSQHM